MSSNLPSLRPREVIAVLKKFGFHPFRQKGSHLILVSASDKVHQPVIPEHTKALKRGTLRSIIRQAGLTIEEFEQARLGN